MPAKLKNPAAKHASYNFSLDQRVKDMLDEEADLHSRSTSALLNEILKNRYGIRD